MSKKRLYIIIAITAIITIGFFLAAYILSQSDGSKTDEKTTNPFENFLPFGKSPTGTPKNTGNNTSSGNTGTGTNPDIINKEGIPALRQISTTATAGYSPSLILGKPSVRFVERSTGNIFETAMEDMRQDRLSNAVVPGIAEAFFANSGKSLVYRYIKDGSDSITTFIRIVPNPNNSKQVVVSGETQPNPVDGSFLPENILNVFVSPDSKNMFYLTKTGDFSNHVAFGNVLNFQKNTSARVFQSPFTEWLPVAFDGKTAVLQTKASQTVPGFVYSMNTSTGELKKILGDINGLTTLPSPDLQKILYSESTRGGITLHLYDRRERKTLDISLQTLPEKCTWTIDNTAIYCAAPDYLPSAEYPDAWYQGSVSFGDAMWKIDAKTGNMSAVFLPSAFGAPNLDMTNPTLSSSADFLYFINKTDSTLWGYKLINPGT
jgi:hypothetical protein